ncbi:hypothetical protein ACR6HW_05045 [Fusibacter sp. JL298sf-3]
MENLRELMERNQENYRKAVSTTYVKLADVRRQVRVLKGCVLASIFVSALLSILVLLD